MAPLIFIIVLSVLDVMRINIIIGALYTKNALFFKDVSNFF